LSKLLLVPLDDVVVFPNMNVTLPVEVAGEERVLLVPRHEGEYARVGTVAEVVERMRLPGGGSAVLIWDGARLTVERTPATTGPAPDAALCPFDSTAWLRLLLAGSTAAALAQDHDCPAEVARFLHDAFPAPQRAPISWPADN
jgi:hypothetical protein